jgi:hypothetical protein
VHSRLASRQRESSCAVMVLLPRFGVIHLGALTLSLHNTHHLCRIATMEPDLCTRATGTALPPVVTSPSADLSLSITIDLHPTWPHRHPSATHSYLATRSDAPVLILCLPAGVSRMNIPLPRPSISWRQRSIGMLQSRQGQCFTPPQNPQKMFMSLDRGSVRALR